MSSKSARLRKRQENRRKETARKRQEDRRTAEQERLARLEEDYKASVENSSSDDGAKTVVDHDSGSSSKTGRSKSRRMDRHRRNADLVHGMAESVRDTNENSKSKDKDDDVDAGKPGTGSKVWVKVVAIVAVVGMLVTGGVMAFVNLM